MKKLVGRLSAIATLIATLIDQVDEFHLRANEQFEAAAHDLKQRVAQTQSPQS